MGLSQEERMHKVFYAIHNIVECVRKIEDDNEEIRLQDTVYGDLGMDSLDIVEMIMEMEMNFDFSFPDEHVEDIKTLQDFVNYCEDILTHRHE